MKAMCHQHIRMVDEGSFLASQADPGLPVEIVRESRVEAEASRQVVQVSNAVRDTGAADGIAEGQSHSTDEAAANMVPNPKRPEKCALDGKIDCPCNVLIPY